MKETRQAARRRGRRRTLWALTPVALVAAGALVCAAVVFRPGHQAGTGDTAASTAAGSRGTAVPGPGASAGSTSPTATRSRGSGGSPAPPAPPPTAAARPAGPAAARPPTTTAARAGRVRP
ncbi:hypothetical protein ACFYW9_22500, partial [Streptomyces sp. NPDC002698]